MVQVGPYPIETSYYPEHLIIPLITLLIFVVMLYVIARISKKQIEAAPQEVKDERTRLVAQRGTPIPIMNQIFPLQLALLHELNFLL